MTRLVIALALAAAALAGPASAGAQTRTAAPALGDLKGLADFQAMFDKDRGRHRIVLLLSPT